MFYEAEFCRPDPGSRRDLAAVPGNILVQNENMATSLAVLSVHLQAQIKEEKEVKK